MTKEANELLGSTVNWSSWYWFIMLQRDKNEEKVKAHTRRELIVSGVPSCVRLRLRSCSTVTNDHLLIMSERNLSVIPLLRHKCSRYVTEGDSARTVQRHPVCDLCGT